LKKKSSQIAEEPMKHRKIETITPINKTVPELRNSLVPIPRLDPRANSFLTSRGIDHLLQIPSLMERLEKFTIILDLDNTLVCASTDETVKKLSVPIPDYTQKMVVKSFSLTLAVRPGVDSFFRNGLKIC